MTRLLWPALALTFVGMCYPSVASAANYYVDQSCAANGNGLADQCAASTGAAGAFRDPQSCFAAVGAGDTCFIKNGTYITNYSGPEPWYSGGFHVDRSGTASAPITIRNYPGHRPLLANCTPSSTAYCQRATITAPAASYVIFDGLVVHGGFSFFGPGPDQPARGIILRNNEITQGYGGVNDGNWAAIRLEFMQGALIQNNYIHDVFTLQGGGAQSSGACIKLYNNADTIVEYNTCRSVRIPDTQAGGTDDKAEATRNIHRYNWFEDVPSCIRINNHSPSVGVKVYENVCIAGARAGYVQSNGILLLTEINGIDVYNNVIYNFDQGIVIASSGVAGARLYNNIIHRTRVGNYENYQPPVLSNFNTFTAGAMYLNGASQYSSLASYRSATGLDQSSAERDCAFVSVPSNFQLSSASACRSAGRVGGTSSGAVVNLGAYVTSTRVGCDFCGGPPPPPPPPPPPRPEAPSALRILQ